MTAFSVALGGMFGALVRFAVDTALARRAARRNSGTGWPGGTLLVNAAGSAVIGVGYGLLQTANLTGPGYTLLATGLAGGLTTFSSWSVATVMLWRGGRHTAAAINVLLNLALGLALCSLAVFLTLRLS